MFLSRLWSISLPGWSAAVAGNIKNTTNISGNAVRMGEILQERIQHGGAIDGTFF